MSCAAEIAFDKVSVSLRYHSAGSGSAAPRNPPMRTRILPAVLAGALFAAVPARAGTILKWQETTRLEGQPAHRAVMAYSCELGLRVQMLEIGSNVASSVILWVAATGALHVKDGEKGWVTVIPDLISGLRSRARPAPRRETPAVTVRRTGSRHTVNSFSCEAYALQQKGLPSRIVCLGEPGAIGIDDTTRRNFREMSRLLVAFMEAAEHAGGNGPSVEEGIRYNTYDMPAGFPVRVWETRKGETWIDSELVSVSPGDTPASLFEPPTSPQPDHGAPSVSPGVPPRSGR